jgi:nicotinamidase/pyrazinamidase
MKTLIIVDPQNDFCPNGSLPVPNGDKIIPMINELMESEKYDIIIITKDWHPDNHKSFASQHPGKNPFEVIDLNGIQQVLWTDHCIQETNGAEFHPDLNIDHKNIYIFKKGTNPEVDSYSGFYENDHVTSTGLSKFLKEKEVTDVEIVGLALDYCVFYTAIDSSKEGFKTSVLLSYTKAISSNITDVLKKLIDANVSIILN